MERKTIPISELELDSNQSRVDNSVDDSFVESIENVGILQNLVVRPGNDGYRIIAGSRRYSGALKAGLTELPCSVIDANDDEATRASIIENTQREDLTQYETVRSVKMWYDVLCEDLPQANEEGEFESPIEEGKAFDSRKAIKNYHIQQGDIERGGPRNFHEPPLTESDVRKQIAEQSPYGIDTVKQLIRLGKLPHKILILLKTQEERTSEEQKTIETRFSSDYSFNNDSNSAVSTKFLEIDKVLRKASKNGLAEEHYPEFIYTILERRNIDSNTTLLDIRSEFNDVAEKYEGWEGEVIEKARIEKAAMGEEPSIDNDAESQESRETEVDRVGEEKTYPHTQDIETEPTEDGDGEVSSSSPEEVQSEKTTTNESKTSNEVETEERNIDTGWNIDGDESNSDCNDEESTDGEQNGIDGKFIVECFDEQFIDMVSLKKFAEDIDFTPEEIAQQSSVVFVEE